MAKKAKPEPKSDPKQAAKSAPAAEGGEAPAPRKRSKLKLALFALVPLVLAGGGFAGWTFFLGPQAEADSHAAEAGERGEGHDAAGDGHGEADAMKVASIEPEIAAESSFTYSFALAELVRAQCGGVRIHALKAASEEEAKADGTLVNLSWMAANRRLGTITDRSCDYVLGEIIAADGKAARLAAEKAAGEKGKDKGGH